MQSRHRNAGFTLVEIMIVVAIIGVLAAVAVQGVRSYVAYSKTAEAKNMVGAIGRAAVAAYELRTPPSENLKGGKFSKAAEQALCKSAKPVPKKVPKGVKYQPHTKSGKDFDTGNGTKGWRCLKFSISQPIYYRYTYVKGKGGLVAKKNPAKPDKSGFEVAAQGDLDGDKTRSTFAFTGRVDDKTKALRTATQIYIEAETE